MKSQLYVKKTLTIRYGIAKKLKLGKALYSEDIECAFIAGYLEAMANIDSTHRKTPYKTADEVIGYAQEQSVEHFNYFVRKYSPKTEPMVTVEKVIG